jgi:hypothetical protein
MDSSWVLDGEGRDDISHGLCKSQKRRWSLHPDKFSLQLAEAEHTSGGLAAIRKLQCDHRGTIAASSARRNPRSVPAAIVLRLSLCSSRIAARPQLDISSGG